MVDMKTASSSQKIFFQSIPLHDRRSEVSGNTPPIVAALIRLAKWVTILLEDPASFRTGWREE